MTATRAPEVLDWLGDVLPPVLVEIERRAGWEVQLTEGWPGDQIQTDTVVIGAYRTEQDEANLGARYRTETLTFDVEILAIRHGGTATEVREAVHEIADAISARMRQNPSGLTIGGAVCRARLSPVEYQQGLSDNARTGWLHCELTAHEARL